MQKPVLKGGDTGVATTPSSTEKKQTMKAMLMFGCFITAFSFCNPMIIHWSLGSSMPETISFHSLLDLIANAASCLAWLLFGIVQLHQEDGITIGVPTVVLNVVGVSMYVLFIIIKGASGQNVGKKGCVEAVILFVSPLFVTTCVMVYHPVKKDSEAAVWISFFAALIQIICQILPFGSICLLCCPPAGAPAPHPNTKNLIVYGRSCNLLVTGYWAWYCVCTYDHTFFRAANVVSTILAFVTWLLHLGYALEPQAHGHVA